MQRKLLVLASSMTLLIALSYVVYFAAIGLWFSAGRAVFGAALGLAVLGFGLMTKRYRAALNTLSVTLFITFALASYLQDGIFSPALWWMLMPPMISVLAGSLSIGSGLFAAFLVHTALLYWHGPGSWGSVSLMAKDRELQMLLTIVFSTIFLSTFIGMGRRWLLQVKQSLEQARAAAIEATEVKARFLSNMSHEIRTPLNGMIGATQILRDQKVSSLQRRQLFAVQEQSAKMLMSLVNDILDFSKLEAQKVQIEHTETKLRPLLFHVNELFSVTAFERGIELSSSYDRAMPQTVLADSTRLRQILSNLVSNAVKFTERGGVHVHLGFDKGTAVPARNADASAVWVRFDVSDSGPGIDADKIASLFRPFEQADGSITRRYGGTGLGLAICNELAQLMGGRIEVTSRMGRGSVFSLVVLLAVAEAAPPLAQLDPLLGPLLLVTRTPGLWRHVKLQLEELGVSAVQSEEIPSMTEIYRTRAAYVLVDAQVLASAPPPMAKMLDELAETGVRVGVIAPLGGDALVQPYRRVALLYKPVRRGGLRGFLHGDQEHNLRESHEAPHSIDSAFDETADTEPMPLRRPRAMTVLVADDNPINQLVAQAILEDMDAHVITVPNGRRVLDVMSHTAVDFILMDIQMPEMDGITATRLLRENERAAHRSPTPVIAITGNNAGEDRQACLAAGMNTVLVKPYTAEQLRGAMAQSG